MTAAGVPEPLLIFLAGLAAGAINSVAGGGTLLSFPVLLWLGRDPIAANVANTVALFPASLASAYAFRRELRASAPGVLAVTLPVSVLGAALGSWLLLATPTRWFGVLVPGLILLATLLLALKRPLLAGFAAAFGQPTRAPDATATSRRLLALGIGQLLVAIYGGYFGAAMGIMMLAALSLTGIDDIHQRNALKNAAGAVINAVAAALFISAGAVDWSDALLLGLGATLGGYVGGSLGRRLNQKVAEGLVVTIGLGAALMQILRAH